MIATPVKGWRDTCDTVVDDVLNDACVSTMPVDALEVASALGVEVVLDRSLMRRATSQRSDRYRKIRVRPEESVESLQWTVAHELGEQLTDRVCDVLNQGEQGRVPVFGGLLREQVANELAGRILLPRRWFLDAVDRTDGDLTALKDQFSTASNELIMLGMLRWPEPSVVTLFDCQSTTRRFANDGPAPKLSPLEFDVWNECRRSGRAVAADADGQHVQAWAVHNEDHKREYLRTTESATNRVVQAELFEMAG